MKGIWYVMYCKNGQETTMMEACRSKLSKKALSDTFLFTYERLHKYLGEWHRETSLMFPDYIFLESGNGEALAAELSHLPGMGRVLGDGKDFTPVSMQEEQLLRALGGQNHHVGLSRGIIRNGTAQVTEGPLQGQEHLIRRIDRHKRLAVLGTTLLYRPVQVYTGLEITARVDG